MDYPMDLLPEDLTRLCKLSMSAQEEIKAYTDYKVRAKMCGDKVTEKLFEHLANEEAKHFAMLVSKIAHEEDAIGFYLQQFISHGDDPLKSEDD